MKLAVPGFEPGLPDSESGVLTTTLYRSHQAEVAEIAFADYMFHRQQSMVLRFVPTQTLPPALTCM